MPSSTATATNGKFVYYINPLWWNSGLAVTLEYNPASSFSAVTLTKCATKGLFSTNFHHFSFAIKQTCLQAGTMGTRLWEMVLEEQPPFISHLRVGMTTVTAVRRHTRRTVTMDLWWSIPPLQATVEAPQPSHSVSFHYCNDPKEKTSSLPFDLQFHRTVLLDLTACQMSKGFITKIRFGEPLELIS